MPAIHLCYVIFNYLKMSGGIQQYKLDKLGLGIPPCACEFIGESDCGISRDVHTAVCLSEIILLVAVQNSTQTCRNQKKTGIKFSPF